MSDLTYEVSSTPGGDLAALFDAAKLAAAGIETFTIDDPELEVPRRIVVTTPPDYATQVIELDPERYTARPFARRGTVEIRTAEGLIAHAHQRGYHGPATGLYYLPENMSALVVFDDHEPQHGDDYPQHGWRRDRATLKLAPTPSWERWASVNRKMLAQGDFADLVEDGIADIVEPAGADLLDMAQTMTGTVGATWRASQRLADGRVQASYVEDVEMTAGAAGNLAVPQSITLRLAPFHGASPVDVTARLRTRVAAGKLTVTVIIDRIEDVLLAAVEREVAKIASDLGVTAVCVAQYPAALEPQR